MDPDTPVPGFWIRIYGEGMKGDSVRLYVGNLPLNSNEENLREYFKTFGEVADAIVIRDRETGQSRGFGFVVFSDPAVAEQVVMKEHMIDGRLAHVAKASEKQK